MLVFLYVSKGKVKKVSGLAILFFSYISMRYSFLLQFL